MKTTFGDIIWIEKIGNKDEYRIMRKDRKANPGEYGEPSELFNATKSSIKLLIAEMRMVIGENHSLVITKDVLPSEIASEVEGTSLKIASDFAIETSFDLASWRIVPKKKGC